MDLRTSNISLLWDSLMNFAGVTHCVDFQRRLVFLRSNCNPVFSNGYFEAKKKAFGLVFATDSEKKTREPYGMVKNSFRWKRHMDRTEI